MTRADPSPGERRARVALVVLCLLAPLLYLPRVLLGRTTPMPARTPPAWTHLVVVTVGAWPDPPGLGAPFDDPVLAAFDRTASRVALAVAPSTVHAATAASLWTGRYPRGHGVLTSSLALPAGAWTLARAARSADTRTAAFLQEPFVSATAIGGFDEVVEDAGADARALADGAADFLARTRGDRVLVWLHLAAAGPGASDVATVLGRIERALDETDRTPESAIALATFARAADASVAEDGSLDALTAPLWVALPGALSIGRRSDARLSLVDLGATLTLLLGVEVPAQARQDGRAATLWNALRGGGGDPGVFVQGDRDVWSRGDRLVVSERSGGEVRALAREQRGAWLPLGEWEAASVLAEARAAEQALTAASVEAVPARVPEGAWGHGWPGTGLEDGSRDE